MTVAPLTRLSDADNGLVAMITAYVVIQVQVGRSAEVSEEIARIEHVTSSDIVSVPIDVIAVVEALTSTPLGKLVAARIQAVDGVTRTLTCPVLSL